MSVRLGRVEGVEAVRISLNEGKAFIELKAGNTVTLGELRTVVQHAGFKPDEARVRARVQVALDGGRVRLRVIDTPDTYEAASAEPKLLADLKKRAGDTVVVEGVIEAPTPEGVARLTVSSIVP